MYVGYMFVSLPNALVLLWVVGDVGFPTFWRETTSSRLTLCLPQYIFKERPWLRYIIIAFFLSAFQNGCHLVVVMNC